MASVRQSRDRSELQRLLASNVGSFAMLLAMRRASWSVSPPFRVRYAGWQHLTQSFALHQESVSWQSLHPWRRYGHRRNRGEERSELTALYEKKPPRRAVLLPGSGRFGG